MRKANFNELLKIKGTYFSDAEYRAFLDNVDIKWHIESSSTHQSGDIKKIIRNRHGIPVCFQVSSFDDKNDYIAADRVNFYEPWDCYVSNFDEYDKKYWE